MMYHQPVLFRESIEGLDIKEGGTYVDLTFGGGGHSAGILEKLANGKLYAFDHDEETERNLFNDGRLVFINQNFRYLRNYLSFYKAIPVDGILADLGVSSHQFDTGERGFSFRFDQQLDLRMNRRKEMTAGDIINHYTTAQLRLILSKYGEVTGASRIAGEIVSARVRAEIRTTGELTDILRRFAPRGKENKFFAQVFQALRIEVNDELGALREMLVQSSEVLRQGGRLVIITYHSLEDRIVKNFIHTGNAEGVVNKDFFGNVLAPFRAVVKKPVVPSGEEIGVNSRARSAKLRIAEKL